MSTSSEEKLRADLAALRVERPSESLATKGRARGRSPLLWLGIAAAVVLGIAAIGLRATPVSVASAVLADAAALLDAPVLTGSGYIVPGDKVVAIGARVPGRVERYLVDDGSIVKAGDALVQLDDREYRAALDRTRAQLEVARANLRLAESELTRGKELANAHYLAPSELDIRRNKVEVGRATIHELEAALIQAEVSLEYTILRAPTDGVVLAKLKEAGEIAVPGGFAGSGDLVRLANLHDLRAEVDVNESDLSQVHLAQRAQVTPDADGSAHYAAEVVKLYPQVDRQKGTLKVEVRILEPDGRLLPDMSARVAFLPDKAAGGAASSQVVLIPTAALRRENDGRSYVWVVDAGRARRSDVETAGVVGDRVRITHGLKGDEKLVVGTPPSANGVRVSVVP